MVATVVPQGNEFRIHFDERQVLKAYPEYAAQQASTRQSKPITQENFKETLQREALSKLRTLFPNGVPPGSVGKIKISISVKFKPPEVGISVEW